LLFSCLFFTIGTLFFLKRPGSRPLSQGFNPSGFPINRLGRTSAVTEGKPAPMRIYARSKNRAATKALRLKNMMSGLLFIHYQGIIHYQGNERKCLSVCAVNISFCRRA
jgi:hypothetical protein